MKLAVQQRLKILNSKVFTGDVRLAAVIDGHLGAGCAKATKESVFYKKRLSSGAKFTVDFITSRPW
jgi:hypothetical protein